MRGEHVTIPEDALLTAGSSPHARGTPGIGRPLRVAEGIIPACAGNTSSTPLKERRRRDHPRMRGEHRVRYRPVQAMVGSSPHARGTHRIVRHHVGIAGIIPACAGNTCLRLRLCNAGRDHPRMRGEHADGSESSRSDRGIIPACAGNTVAVPAWRRWSRDHPRMRGEHSRIESEAF